MAGFAISHGLYKGWKTMREKEAIRDSNEEDNENYINDT